MMKIKKITLYQIALELKNPFVTSYGKVTKRPSIVIEIEDKDGFIGLGECVAFSDPFYTEETLHTCLHIMKEFLIPLLFKERIKHPDEVGARFIPIRRNNMSKAALEGAVWDLYAKRERLSLANAIGGTKKEIEIGIAIGLKKVPEMLAQIEKSLAQGYKRVKIKIKPGIEHEILEAIRNSFPHLPLMVDANSAYTVKDFEILKSLDRYDLMMIEQPLACDDLFYHAKLQEKITTPICLDESITSVHDLKVALEMRSCKVVNLKPSRVGGISAAKSIHDLCKEHNIALWGGGMLEAGIARAQALALYSLPHFSLPADTAGSNKYWENDIILPEIKMNNGIIKVSENIGIGYKLNQDILKKVLVHKEIFYN
ncbi:O-succinylbenzoate synthase [Desulfonispora thiosulfatigenes DSM 11270]|uniref:o-succinylbenzoate synthase n=1 Tax=Desulfonispora thiosulfatigenes DSM 11270 TaxID=656914 RepID=A0A1W1UVB9_DESTI|nr:o-succinylbenzoate synthase [Desulfonispora thiosulfatigenes]SMB84929.1 O-succinylbenzoate synthase [Desulfonispora thiosulfatigenes DSM 11270]